MRDPAGAIRAAWQAVGGGMHPETADDLLARYAEPHRHYHTADHIMWVLYYVDELLAEGIGESIPDRQAIVAAALFHDAIYDPRSTDNEAVSARLAVDALTRVGWPDERCSEVSSMIMATAGHTCASYSQAVLVDADLAILGSSAGVYLHYVSCVRAEYSHVPEQQWKVGRTAILEGFLATNKIFTLPSMVAAREQAARENIAAELGSLR